MKKYALMIFFAVINIEHSMFSAFFISRLLRCDRNKFITGFPQILQKERQADGSNSVVSIIGQDGVSNLLEISSQISDKTMNEVSTIMHRLQKKSVKDPFDDELKLLNTIFAYAVNLQNKFQHELVVQIKPFVNPFLQKMAKNKDRHNLSQKIEFLVNLDTAQFLTQLSTGNLCYRNYPLDDIDCLNSKIFLMRQLMIHDDGALLSTQKYQFLKNNFNQDMPYNFFYDILWVLKYEKKHNNIDIDYISQVINVFIQKYWKSPNFRHLMEFVHLLKTSNFPLEKVDFTFLVRALRTDFCTDQEAIDSLLFLQKIFESYLRTHDYIEKE